MMPGQDHNELPGDIELGEWLYRELASGFRLETEAWAKGRMVRVARQLQIRRAPAAPLEPVLLWLSEMTAFTAPGRYVYISRELLQRAASDDPVALAIAHEIAHHDLGHLNPLRGRLEGLRRLPVSMGVSRMLRLVERCFIGPEQESAADAYAFDLCLKADYDGYRCLELFDILEAYALDRRDLDIVFGPDSDCEMPDGPHGWLARARTWGWERLRGYVPIRDRKAALLDRLPG